MVSPEGTTVEQAKEYFEKNGLEQVSKAISNQTLGINEKITTRIPLQPDLVDLYRLHRLIIENKRTTVLEFGTGWSTLVMAHALNELKKGFIDSKHKLRRNNIFELHVLDDEPEFIEISKSRIPSPERYCKNAL